MRFCFCLCWVCFSGGRSLEIDKKLAAVRFDQFVRGERIHERPTLRYRIQSITNRYDILLLLPSAPLIHEIKRNTNAIRSPTPSYRPRSTACIFNPAVVFRPSSPHPSPSPSPFAPELHLIRYFDILYAFSLVQRLMYCSRRSCSIV